MWNIPRMKPVGDNQASAFLLVAGHGLSLVIVSFALHLTASGCRIFSDELEWAMPGFACWIMSADLLLRTWWLWLAPVAGFALWLDWKVVLRLLQSPNVFPAKFWAYCVFGSVFLATALFVAWFRYWLRLMDQPIGGPG